MYILNSYITVAIYLTLIVSVVSAMLHWHNISAADSRMKRMMVSCGLNEETVLYAEHLLKLDMDEVRSRCRNCAVADLCDRWLEGEPVGSARFCPSIWSFTAAAHARNS